MQGGEMRNRSVCGGGGGGGEGGFDLSAFNACKPLRLSEGKVCVCVCVCVRGGGEEGKERDIFVDGQFDGQKDPQT